MDKHKIISFFLLFFGVALCGMADELDSEKIDKERIKGEINEQLSRVTAPDDSLKLLYDLFDLSNQKGSIAYGKMIYDLSRRMGRDDVTFDMIRRLVLLHMSNDSIAQSYLDAVREYPDSDDKRETETFANLAIRISRATYGTEADRQQQLHQLLEEYTRHGSDKDIYERITELFLLCKYLSGQTEGDLLTLYYDKLQDYIEKLPRTSNALRNMFYSQAAVAYDVNGNAQKSVDADRQLLKIIDELSAKYAQEGRVYRNYDRHRYISLRRMLSNYDVLFPHEIENCYNGIIELCETDSDVAFDMQNNRRAEAYYLLAHKRYDEAIPLLKTALENSRGDLLRMKLLRHLKAAATEVGDKETLLETAQTYNDLLEEFIDLNAQQRYRELQIIYDVNSLKARNTELALVQSEETGRTKTMILVVSAVAIIGLVVLLFILFRYNRRLRSMSENLFAANEELLAERDNLQRTQKELIEARDEARKAEELKSNFINSMSHEVAVPLNSIVENCSLIVDSVDDDKRRYLASFAHTINANVELLQSIVNEVLDIGMIDASKIVLDRKLTSVKAICNIVASSLAHRVPEGVAFRFLKNSDKDVIINTDPKRIEQILNNLLSNALKFTKEGTIDLDYTLSPDGSQLSFIITDTGCGIPEGAEEEIFRRYVKLDKSTRGIGLGLTICRSIATILDGTVKVDTSYKNGARFVFTIPV